MIEGGHAGLAKRQTRWVQNSVSARAFGFDSRDRHDQESLWRSGPKVTLTLVNIAQT